MKVRYIAILISIILFGCTSDEESASNNSSNITNNQVAQTNNPNSGQQDGDDSSNIAQNTAAPSVIPTLTATPTDTPFPTSTPMANPTDLPSELDTIPEYNPNDVAVVAGTYVFQIMDADIRSQIGENRTASDGHQFLIFDAILYNYSDNEQNFFRTNFELELSNSDRILPNVERMEDLQEQDINYQNINFPGRSTIRLNVLSVPAHQWQNIFLVYEIPEPIDELTLIFNPANINPPSTIGVWVIEGEQGDTYGVYKAYDNGVALYSIDFEFTNRRVQLEELIDEELIEVDNCFGNETITRTFTFREEITTSYNIGANAASAGMDAVGSAAGFLMGNPIVGQIITSSFTGFFDFEEAESIEVTREEQLAAAPGTMTRYQLSWYRVTLQGTLQMQVGGENFYIPYTITDRLRSDLDSLTPGICETDE